jgi:hypothetical protein
MACTLHVPQIAAVDHRDATAPERREHSVVRDCRRAVQRAGVRCGNGIVAQLAVLGFLPGKTPARGFGIRAVAASMMPLCSSTWAGRAAFVKADRLR